MPVLIVDDDTPFRTVLAHDLRQCGYTVLVSAGFESMLDVLLKETPSAAIVDAQLPYGESRQAVTLLRRCGVPFVLLNERDAAVGRWQDESATSEVALTKPLGLGDLDRRLRQLRTPVP